MNLIQEHRIYTKETKICKVLQPHNWKLPPNRRHSSHLDILDLSRGGRFRGGGKNWP